MKIIFDSEKQKKDFIQELADYCSCPRQFSLDECCDTEVIGNIFDNPELF